MARQGARRAENADSVAAPALPRSTFTCLWCGKAWTVRSADDLEGYAQLCPDCLGKAGDNAFLRFRLRAALDARSAARQQIGDGAAIATAGGSESASASSASASSASASSASASSASASSASPSASSASPGSGVRPTAGPLLNALPERLDDAAEREMVAYYEARAGEYDDWYLRRGRYAHGPIHDASWNAELDAAGRWLDELEFPRGRIIELAAGTGWWSPLLASKGELWMSDAAPAPLERARERLLAHGLRAHLHVRDAWAEPEGDPATGLFAGFWVSHVERERTAAFLDLARRWLAPGGRLALIDSLPDPQSGARDHEPPADDRSIRRLADGRAFTVVKVYRAPDDIAAALGDAGFVDVDVRSTGRFFVLATAVRPPI
jgi:demethylmenaquinone methyltransferase/2-methoxy-6-polyprenyl-1,4-benzoquinol methylase